MNEPKETKLRLGIRDRLGKMKEKLSSSASKTRLANTTPSMSTPPAENPALSHNVDVQPIKQPATQGVSSNNAHLVGQGTETGEIAIDGPNGLDSVANCDPTVAEQVLRPIREVWDEAYEDLRAEDEDLITKYEDRLRESVYGGLASTLGKMQKQDLMKTVVDHKLEQYKADTWKVKALGEEFLVKDMAKPLVGITKWADKYVSEALTSNPLASFGWAGVMVFLPLLLNPSAQEKALLEGLASVSDVLVRSTMQENLYFRRWEANADKNDRADFMPSHKGYRDTLKALYIQVLKYQATSVCYFTRNGGLRILADMVKWHAWEDMLKDVQKQDEAMCRTYDRLSDVKIEEEFEKLDKRHEQMVEIFNSGFDDVAALREAVERAQRDRERTELLDWLSSVDPSLNYNNARTKHENGTGDWLIRNNDDFDSWKVAPNSLMWLNGKAGSGKSVLSSSVISHLEEAYRGDPQVALAYFYFSFNDEQKQTAVGMIESIIKQICCCRPDTPLSVKALGDLKARGHRPDLKTLQKTLIESLRGFSRVFVIIDALDECPDTELNHDREVLLACLAAIHEKSSKNMHMFLTSRREKDIEGSIYSPGTEAFKWDIDLLAIQPAIDHDIGLFIDCTLSSRIYNSWPPELKAEARTELIAKSDGMFQYIACQFEALRTLKGETKIRKALHDLPKGLDATYDRMLERIDPADQKQVARVLEWLSFSLRPLLLEEVAEIFILDPNSEVPFDEENRLLPGAVLDYLCGLVTVVPRHIHKNRYDCEHYARRGKDVVEIRLAHFSIKEYLECGRMSSMISTAFGIKETNAHMHITESCLAYHLYLSKTVVATKKLVRQYQLWEYVVEYWPKHLDVISTANCTPSITERALEVFTRDSQGLLNMTRIRGSDHPIHAPYWTTTADELFPPPLYHACSIGALQLTELILEVDNASMVDEISHKSGHGFALQAAAYHRHEAIVRLLLEKGADVNVQGGKYGNALQAAAYNGRESIVQLLLDKGAEVNAQGGDYKNALQAAAIYGWESIVQLLLDNGAEVNAQGGQYGNALQVAARSESESIVQLLLDKGADINAKGGSYGNAVQAAVIGIRWEIAELLLLHGAAVDSPGPEWEELLARMERRWGRSDASRLRKFQENPTVEGLAQIRKEEEDSQRKAEEDRAKMRRERRRVEA